MAEGYQNHPLSNWKNYEGYILPSAITVNANSYGNFDTNITLKNYAGAIIVPRYLLGALFVNAYAYNSQLRIEVYNPKSTALTIDKIWIMILD